MATPIAAGSAVLVRQYFMDGWYPTGSAVSGNKFEPLGSLVKAMMIGATFFSPLERNDFNYRSSNTYVCNT